MVAHYARLDCYDVSIAFDLQLNWASFGAPDLVVVDSVAVDGMDFRFDCGLATTADSSAVMRLEAEIVSKNKVIIKTFQLLVNYLIKLILHPLEPFLETLALETEPNVAAAVK